MRALVVSAAEHDAYLTGNGWIRITRDQAGHLDWDRVAPNRVILEAAPSEVMCGQCGEQHATMLKVGTADAWCPACLDEAAEDALRARLEPLLAKANGMRPDHFRTGQDHLPPAFREIDFKAAFLALAEVFNEIEAAVTGSDA